MRSIDALLEATDPRWIRVAGMIRRMAISLTTQVLWQLAGFRLPDGSREVTKAEAFTGIGFFARPPSSGEPEAIIVSLGDASAPMIVAVRDEKTRAAVMGALQIGETAMYTDKAVVYLKSDGTIEARSGGGGAAPLATKADLDALKNAILGWAPVPTDGGAALKVALVKLFTGPPVWPAGTTRLKAE